MSIEYKKISELDAATALDGTEVVEVAQSGASVKATGDQVAAFALDSIGDLSAASTIDGTELIALIQGGSAVQAALSSCSIIEQGSNSNGEYVIFSNGLQVCWWTKTVTDQAISNAYVGIYQGTRTRTYPAAFASVPAVTCGIGKWGAGAAWSGLSGASTTTVILRFWDMVSRATGTAMPINYIAIGWAG